MKKIDARALIALGVVLFIYSCYLNAQMTRDTGYDQLLWSQIVRAVGQPFMMTPLSLIAYEGIEAANIGSASGLYNMMRNLGGSVGIGLLGTLLSRRYRFHFSRISESIPQVDISVQERLQSLAGIFQGKGFSPEVAKNQAVQALAATMNREANIMGYADCFLFLMAVLAIGGLGIFFLGKSKGGSAPVGAH
jgi:DHA2 family multidrug resistance protein